MAEKWNSSIQFPQDNYVLRCIEESFGPSKGTGSPMITLKYEITSPESINVAGKDYNVLGQTVTGYYTTAVLDDEEKTKGCIERTFVSTDNERPSLYELFGLDGAAVDKNNPKLEFKGKLIHARLKGDATEKRKSPTAEQLAKGQREGDVLKNPITGKPEIVWFPKVDKIYGLAEQVISANAAM